MPGASRSSAGRWSGLDNDVAPQQLRLPEGEIDARYEANLLGGAMVLEGMAEQAVLDGWGETLYRTTPVQFSPTRFKAIPYHLWANREPSSMLVWIREA